MKKIVSSLLISTFCLAANAAAPNHAFDKAIQSALKKHFSQYQNLEYFSALSASVYLPGSEIKNYVIGRMSHDTKSEAINQNTLFQIGSITKSFTGALVLSLEKEGKLNLDETIKQLLPKYSQWNGISVKQMLNMSSGLPNYSDTPLWNVEEYKNPARNWEKSELIQFAYPREGFSPPLKQTYFYTNTGYVLLDMLIESKTNQSFKKLLQDKVLSKANLTNTFFPTGNPGLEIRRRMASGYAFNQYDNPYILGRDMKGNNLSWAGAAGAIVATPEDIVKWVKALFIDDVLLDKDQKVKLTSLVSVQTGEPIADVSKDQPKGFGLGVIKNYDEGIGSFWYYEGQTLGYRALYMYVPCNQVIIASVVNSATNGENDHSANLMKSLYKAVLQQNPALVCQS